MRPRPHLVGLIPSEGVLTHPQCQQPTRTSIKAGTTVETRTSRKAEEGNPLADSTAQPRMSRGALNAVIRTQLEFVPDPVLGNKVQGRRTHLGWYRTNSDSIKPNYRRNNAAEEEKRYSSLLLSENCHSFSLLQRHRVVATREDCDQFFCSTGVRAPMRV
jgi:hypothetical protein